MELGSDPVSHRVSKIESKPKRQRKVKMSKERQNAAVISTAHHARSGLPAERGPPHGVSTNPYCVAALA